MLTNWLSLGMELRFFFWWNALPAFIRQVLLETGLGSISHRMEVVLGCQPSWDVKPPPDVFQCFWFSKKKKYIMWSIFLYLWVYYRLELWSNVTFARFWWFFMNWVTYLYLVVSCVETYCFMLLLVGSFLDSSDCIYNELFEFSISCTQGVNRFSFANKKKMIVLVPFHE